MTKIYKGHMIKGCCRHKGKINPFSAMLDAKYCVQRMQIIIQWGYHDLQKFKLTVSWPLMTSNLH